MTLTSQAVLVIQIATLIYLAMVFVLLCAGRQFGLRLRQLTGLYLLLVAACIAISG